MNNRASIALKDGETLEVLGIKPPEYIVLNRDKRKLLMDGLNTSGAKAIVDQIAPATKEKGYVKRILDLDNPIDDYGNTLLHLAVAQKDHNLVAILLVKGANPNVWNHSGASPLRMAKLLKIDQIIMLLSRHGAANDHLPVHHVMDDVSAIQNTDGDSDDAAEDQPSPNKSRSSSISSNSSPISPGTQTFVSRGHSSSISSTSSRAPSMSTRKPSVNVTNIYSRFPKPTFDGQEFGNAAYLGIQNFSELLADIQHADIPDVYLCSPLMKACYKNQVEAVKNLLDKGVNVLSTDMYGYNALIWASLAGAETCAKFVYGAMSACQKSDEILKPYGNGKNGPILTPLMASAYGGNLELVEFFVEMGSPVSQTCGGYDAFKISFLMGHKNVYDFLRKKGAIIPKNDAWFTRGITLTESAIPMSQKTNPIPYNPLEKTAKGYSLQTVAAKEIEKFNFVMVSKDESKTKSTDIGIHEWSRGAWAARMTWNRLREHKFELPKAEELLDKLKIKVSDQYLDPVGELLEYFQLQGTVLDLMHMQMVKSVLQLIQAISNNSKTEYVVIAGKAIQDAGDIVKLIESWVDKKNDPKPSSQYQSLFNQSYYYQKIRDLCKTLRNDDVKAMLLVTRLAVGAWPPPDAVDNMIKAGLKVGYSCKILVELVGAAGNWPISEISLDQITGDGNASAPSSPTKASGGFSFSEYQKQHEAKILSQIVQSSNEKSSKPEGADKSQAASADASKEVQGPTLDDPFYASLDNLVRQFVQAVQALKAAMNEERKEEYSSLASAIYARVDAIIEEIRDYYVFKDVEDDFVVRDKEPPYKKRMQSFREALFTIADDAIMKAKLASGVWPPVGAADDMIQAVIPLVAIIKELVKYVKEATVILRKTENQTRMKMEKHMSEWVQNQKVRDLFTQWEKIQIQTLKSEQDQNIDASNLTPEESKLLEDSSDGIIIEYSNGKQIVKAGRIWKLVEKLADHSTQDAEYRMAFLLTHHSFTNSADLLDLLIKRYDINPPLGLDQRMFEIYVNKKIVPVRLRVFNILKMWMNKYSEDFTKNRALTEKCIRFVQTKIANDFGEIAAQLMQSLNRLLVGQVAQVQMVDLNAVNTKPILPKGILLDEISQFLAYHPRAFIDIDPLEFARQVTLVDFNIFKDIRPKEFLDQAWEKRDKATRSPNITRLIKHTNNLTMWAANSIVHCDDLKSRVNLIRYYVTVAAACKEINSFSAITAFVAALSMGPVFRMTRTMQAFREKYPKLAETYSELSEMVSAKGQYAKYRQLFKDAVGPKMPHLGVYLTDLTFIDLGNTDYLPENNYINFDKRRKTALIVNEIQQHQLNQYYFTEVPGLKDFIQSFGVQGWPDEKALYERSWIAEPKEENSDEED